ncbi:hypothetical protein G9C98_003239 [Cotesia typhae]|uniref:Uncharacterized protein n=1 Tax=Cotesia typhae TaxID=2053667 RepID=A0A8J5R2G4_9HYME|nr:hypothetical protein G9C98_003239 [Cotesia typhae]
MSRFISRKTNRMNTTIMNLEQAHFMLLQIYNKEGPKLGSGYEVRDITVIILKNNQILMKTEKSHFSVTITLMPENVEDFENLCKKIKEAEISIEEDSPEDDEVFEDNEES